MTLASKIAAASKTVGGRLSADKRNTDANYDYVSSDAILAFGGQALAEHGVAIVPMLTSLEVTPTAYTNNRGEARTRYDALASFIMRISDGETDQEAPWFGLGSDYTVPDKAAYKAITSGHKYFLAKLLNIGAGNEDGEHEPGEEGKSAEKPIAGRQQTPTEIKQRKNGNVPNCPKCAGPMWDNREGKTNPKQPDFKCKNKECGGAIWPPKDAQQQPSNQPEPQNDDAPKLAAIRTPKFGPYATTLADKWPKYRNAQGSFDANHIQASIATNLKVYDITDANIDAIFAKLHQRAIDAIDAENAPA